MVAVSVLMACYNAAPYLARATTSLQQQSMEDWELFIVDDASTDATAAIARSLADADPRISVTSNIKNLGPSAARNVGLSQAKGEWITILDADDAYEPQRLEHMLQIIAACRADMVFDNLILWDDAAQQVTGTALPLSDSDPVRFTITDLVESEAPKSRLKFGFFKPLIRLEFLRRHAISYDVNLRLAEDFDLYARCLLNDAQALLTHAPLYRYTTQIGAVSGIRSEATRTIFDARSRVGLAIRLRQAFATAEFSRHHDLLDKYILWQKLAADAQDLARLRKEWKMWDFAKMALSNPPAFMQFATTSRVYKKTKNVFPRSGRNLGRT